MKINDEVAILVKAAKKAILHLQIQTLYIKPIFTAESEKKLKTRLPKSDMCLEIEEYENAVEKIESILDDPSSSIFWDFGDEE